MILKREEKSIKSKNKWIMCSSEENKKIPEQLAIQELASAPMRQFEEVQRPFIRIRGQWEIVTLPESGEYTKSKAKLHLTRHKVLQKVNQNIFRFPVWND
ncbi:hypothetical protein CDAR_33551 [Caerostris darwini]|uniref:Uncharacterized protein n=1 Tax=Caerostris darwini TaxID=1538125 RepID=A0AAV4QPD3_9ARAC|nr:hypothetical protein CDAR_33551 [Caerostris darwini]